ncbi:MAG: hypothetical protein ACREYE_17315 [Gammaproteobacteria bacterium]
MDQQLMHCATVSLIAACLTSSGLALGATIPPGDTRNAQLGPVEGLVLDDQQGWVEIEARDIPLGALLKALAAQASVEARLAEPSLASCSVNAKRQQAASLREAIERLLQGFPTRSIPRPPARSRSPSWLPAPCAAGSRTRGDGVQTVTAASGEDPDRRGLSAGTARPRRGSRDGCAAFS